MVYMYGSQLGNIASIAPQQDLPILFPFGGLKKNDNTYNELTKANNYE